MSHNLKGDESENVIPIGNAKKFDLVVGKEKEGILIVQDVVGAAYLRSSSYRLKIWLFGKCEFFLLPENGQFVVVSREDFFIDGKKMNLWRKIGTGEKTGEFVRIRVPLLAREIFLKLRDEMATEASHVA